MASEAQAGPYGPRAGPSPHPSLSALPSPPPYVFVSSWHTHKRFGCIAAVSTPTDRLQLIGLPMASLHVQATLQGRIASVVVRQRFDNARDGAVALDEVNYVWPTDEGAVLYALAATTPERTVHAELKEAAVAQAEYEAAQQAGRFAAYGQTVTTRETEVALGNIQAGWTVEVEVRYVVVLPIQAGNERVVEWWLPTFLAPRFGVDAVTGRQAIDATTAIDLHVRVVHSDGCVVTATNGGSGAAPSVRNGDTYLSFDKAGDFQRELRVRVAFPADLPDRVLAAPVPAAAGRPGGYALFYAGRGRPVVPAAVGDEAAAPAAALDLAVVIDRSGSMYDSGAIKPVADAGLKALAACLRPGDRVSLSEFGSAGQDRHPLPLCEWDEPARSALVQRGSVMVADGSLGGTEPYTCVATAILGLHGAHSNEASAGSVAEAPTSDRVQALLFVGDGNLGGRDAELLATLDAAYTSRRVVSSVVAIGSGCNTNLLRRMATQGRGTFQHVLSASDLGQTIPGMVAALREPPVHQLTVTVVGPENAAAVEPVAIGQWTGLQVTNAVFDLDNTTDVAVGGPTRPSHVLPAYRPRIPLPTALVAVAPSSVRASAPVTIALLVPHLPATLRVTAVYLNGGRNGHDEPRAVSLDLAVETAEDQSAWDAVHAPDLSGAPATVQPPMVASELLCESAGPIVALVGAAMLAEVLTVVDRYGPIPEVAAIERDVTPLAVQTLASCRLTAWVAVDRPRLPPIDTDPEAPLQLRVPLRPRPRTVEEQVWDTQRWHGTHLETVGLYVLNNLKSQRAQLDQAARRLDAMDRGQSWRQKAIAAVFGRWIDRRATDGGDDVDHPPPTTPGGGLLGALQRGLVALGFSWFGTTATLGEDDGTGFDLADIIHQLALLQDRGRGCWTGLPPHLARRIKRDLSGAQPDGGATALARPKPAKDGDEVTAQVVRWLEWQLRMGGDAASSLQPQIERLCRHGRDFLSQPA